MRDILKVLRKVSAETELEDYEMKEEIERELGWDVEFILARRLSGLEEGTTTLKILFSNSFLIDARVYENEYLKRIGEDCDYRLKKIKREAKSKIKYDVGYTRICVDSPLGNFIKEKLEKTYKQMLIRVYKPLMKYMKGFYKKDFFGIEANPSFISVYYSLVREDREEANASLVAVIDRLEEIERKMKEYHLVERLKEMEEEFKHKLKEVCRVF